MYVVGKEEIKAIEEVVLSKKYFRYLGANQESITNACEKDWNHYLHSSFSLLTTSGTNALVVGMAAFGIGPGDEIIIPSYTFVATASAIMQVGAIPIIANIDETLTLDLEDVKEKISPKTKAIVAVHMDGLICDLDGLKQLCEEKQILLVEDAAQACGGTYKGDFVGTIGAFGGFSFNVDKVISCGEGGLLVIKDKKYEKQFLQSLVTHDTACQYGQTLKEKLSDLPSFFGLSTRLNNINAAMLKVQLERLPHILRELRKTKKELVQYAKDCGHEVLLGHDLEGDIGTVLHLKASDPLAAIDFSKKIIDLGIKAGPPFLRPAHACWQWFEAMEKDHYYVKGLNPYRLTDKDYSYKKQDFLPTVKVLSETIRVELNFLENKNLKEQFKAILKG